MSPHRSNPRDIGAPAHGYTRLRRVHGEYMAGTRRVHGEYMASTWQVHGEYIHPSLSWAMQASTVLIVVVQDDPIVCIRVPGCRILWRLRG